MGWRGIDWKNYNKFLSCARCDVNQSIDVSPPLAWILFIHAMVDHGIPQEQLERIYFGRTVTDREVWYLPDRKEMFRVWYPHKTRPG